jgi:hypothetical protein
VGNTVEFFKVFYSLPDCGLAANGPCSAARCLEANEGSRITHSCSVPLGVVGGDDGRSMDCGEVGLPVWIDFSKMGVDVLDGAVEDFSWAVGLGFDMPGEVLDAVAWKRRFSR